MKYYIIDQGFDGLLLAFPVLADLLPLLICLITNPRKKALAITSINKADERNTIVDIVIGYLIKWSIKLAILSKVFFQNRQTQSFGGRKFFSC
ncbi:MAG TPA: hypothetical protein VKT28_15535 [Puia sp.]|nr:hypothetical protein [Puia sp.]